MAGSSLPSSLLVQAPSSLSSSPIQFSPPESRVLITSGKRCLVRCFAKKKKISFADQILDYIEGGPKLRKWYGAPELLPKDGSSNGEDEEEEQDDDDLNEAKDAVLVTDGDCDLGQLTSGDASDERFVKKAFRGVGAIISPTEGFLSNVKSLRGVKHALILSQLSVYESSGGIQAMMNSKAKKLAEGDEKAVISSNVPYTIIRTGKLENNPGGTRGFDFSAGVAAKGSISKEDAARICVEALSVIPPTGLIFEVSNGEESVSDWEGQLMKLMQRQSEKK